MSAWICARRSKPATTAVTLYRIHRKKHTPMVPFQERHSESDLHAPQDSRLAPADRKKTDQIVLTSMSMRPGRSLHGREAGGGRQEGSGGRHPRRGRGGGDVSGSGSGGSRAVRGLTGCVREEEGGLCSVFFVCCAAQSARKSVGAPARLGQLLCACNFCCCMCSCIVCQPRMRLAARHRLWPLPHSTHSATEGVRRGASRKNSELKNPVTLAKIARLTDCSMMWTCQLLPLKGFHVLDQLAATARHTTQNAICRRQSCSSRAAVSTAVSPGGAASSTSGAQTAQMQQKKTITCSMRATNATSVRGSVLGLTAVLAILSNFATGADQRQVR